MIKLIIQYITIGKLIKRAFIQKLMIFRKKYLLLKHFTSLTCAVLGSVMESCLSVLHWACRTCSHWAHRGNIPPLKRVRAEETFTDTSSRRKMHRIAWNMRRSLSTTRGIHSPVTGENWPEACLLNTATWEWAKTSREHLPTYLPTVLTHCPAQLEDGREVDCSDRRHDTRSHSPSGQTAGLTALRGTLASHY